MFHAQHVRSLLRGAVVAAWLGFAVTGCQGPDQFFWGEATGFGGSTSSGAAGSIVSGAARNVDDGRGGNVGARNSGVHLDRHGRNPSGLAVRAAAATPLAERQGRPARTGAAAERPEPAARCGARREQREPAARPAGGAGPGVRRRTAAREAGGGAGPPGPAAGPRRARRHHRQRGRDRRGRGSCPLGGRLLDCTTAGSLDITGTGQIVDSPRASGTPRPASSATRWVSTAACPRSRGRGRWRRGRRHDRPEPEAELHGQRGPYAGGRVNLIRASTRGKFADSVPARR